MNFYSIWMGCDPEFFFSRNNQVLGAEKIIPPEGLKYVPGSNKRKGYSAPDGAHTALINSESKIIIDGVQAELNPRPNTCRANLANEIGACFRKMYETIKEDTSLNVDFSSVIEISKKELDSLSEKSKQFGCAPSQNLYTGEESKITVNPAFYKYRSAGGHIHLSPFQPENYDIIKRPFNKIQTTIEILDIIVGNTCVLIDRNPYAKERRKVYGRAGEYRTPEWGIEYRTLSNFWLQSYQLMSLVFGLARTAVLIVANEYENRFTEKIDRKAIMKAINDNEFSLAYENFSKIEEELVNLCDDYSHYPITNETILEFKHFISKDISYWFKEDPLTHWINLPEGHSTGWENFATTKIRNDRLKKEKET